MVADVQVNLSPLSRTRTPGKSFQFPEDEFRLSVFEETTTVIDDRVVASVAASRGDREPRLGDSHPIRLDGYEAFREHPWVKALNPLYTRDRLLARYAVARLTEDLGAIGKSHDLLYKSDEGGSSTTLTSSRT